MEESNKLIAEFMGCTPNRFGVYDMFGVIHTLEQEDKHFYSAEDMLFNSDWNWLIEAVEKIESVGGYSVIISCGNCEIYDCSTHETILHIEGEKLTAVYNAVVEFIKLL